jgi:hypothetical protein
MASRIARAFARPPITRAGMAAVVAVLLGAAFALPAAAGDSTSSSSQHSHGYSMGFHVSSSGHSDFQYAIIESGSNTSCSISDDDAWTRIRTLQDEVESTGHEVMWFSFDGKDYVVRDQAVIERAQGIMQPVNDLGRKQGQLGREQGELGRKQGELGRLEGRIGQLEGRFARLQATSGSESRSELEDLRQQLDELRADARELSERQRQLGAQQHELGARQRELGEQQRIASDKAMIKLRSLADDAIKAGKAERAGD